MNTLVNPFFLLPPFTTRVFPIQYTLTSIFNSRVPTIDLFSKEERTEDFEPVPTFELRIKKGL
jgi:hypothetical protein